MEWFENAAFWDTCAPAMFDDERFAQAQEEMEAAAKLLQLPDGAHVLDLCCGPGRHACALAARGFQVTGVDLHQPYLDRARARNADVEWVRSDMRGFRRDGAFDAAINCFSSFGYFEDEADDLRVIENIHASLKPGGRFLIDTMGKEVLARKFIPRRWDELEGGGMLVQHAEIADGWKTVRNRWILIRGAERSEFRLDLRIFSGAELETLLREGGFAEVRLHGWFDGSDYNHEARRLVAVAR